MFEPTELSIAQLRAALDAGETTSVELVSAYLRRIAAYDRSGIRLNAVSVLNKQMFAEARESDNRRRAGETLGPLDGIPYTAKDSYKVAGMTVAAGSPAFVDLVANEDAYSIGALRAAGAVFIGLTNMPPMADGGMQRGVYGRAESPYNENFLTAAFVSGSSNGAGTATAASLCAFGLAEETWSSGRAPASNNGLVAYTPSRGVISTRGNWPLVPTMDVVVPYARTVPELLELLDVLVQDDPNPRGDFWRVQQAVSIPKSSEVRPESYAQLADKEALKGKRLAIPRMYINADTEAPEPIATRASVVALWQQMRADLESLGAEVIETDFPVVSNYEQDRPGAESMVTRGLVPESWEHTELNELSAWAMDDFLRANGNDALPTLADVDGDMIFPTPAGAVPYDSGNESELLAKYVDLAAAGLTNPAELPGFDAALAGLEQARKQDLENWMDELHLDAVVFPAVADVAPFDADMNPESNKIAYRNGTWVANGNLVPRHLGIPTVTIPMGLMGDIGMPCGLTIAGRAYADSALLKYAYALDQLIDRRHVPPRTPPLEDSPTMHQLATGAGEAALSVQAECSAMRADGTVLLSITGVLTHPSNHTAELSVLVNGAAADVHPTEPGKWIAQVALPAREHYVVHSPWQGPFGSLVQAFAQVGDETLGAYCTVGGIDQ